MSAFFSLGVLDEATRRMRFVQQISSSNAGPIAKVQTMPAEPMHRLDRDRRSARAAGAFRSQPW